MSIQVIVDVPEVALSIVRSTPEKFAREFRLAAAVKWYEVGKISQANAATLAGLGRQEFIDSLSAFGVSPIQITPKELEADFRLA
jgi:predicted HTH domain antitoxin